MQHFRHDGDVPRYFKKLTDLGRANTQIYTNIIIATNPLLLRHDRTKRDEEDEEKKKRKKKKEEESEERGEKK